MNYTKNAEENVFSVLFFLRPFHRYVAHLCGKEKLSLCGDWLHQYRNFERIDLDKACGCEQLISGRVVQINNARLFWKTCVFQNVL